MNENGRIIEVKGRTEPVKIFWQKDPTRHLLNETAVNERARNDGPVQSKTPTGDDGDDPASTE